MKKLLILAQFVGIFVFGMVAMHFLERYHSYKNPIDQLVKYSNGFLISRALYVVAELKIADALVDKSKTAQEIAEELNVNTDAVFRLLRMLASHGIFIYKDDKFALNDVAQLITTTHQKSMHGFLLHEDFARWNAYAQMSYSIKTGKPTFNYLYGEGYFDFIAHDQQKFEQFDQGMATFSETENKQVATHFDFASYSKIIDIGGGIGGLLAQILDKNKNVYGILYELPHLQDNAKKYFIDRHLEKRTDVVAGSFLREIIPGGNLYIFKRILHDWDDQTCLKILQNCVAVMDDTAKIVIFDCVVPDGSVYDISKDIDMVMMVIFGGKERTKKDFKNLFAAVGLQLDKISPIEGTMLFAVEGSKIKK